jgi:hypothetical protein
MGKRAAVVFTVLAVVLLQWLASDTQSMPELYMLAPPVSQPRVVAPQMMAGQGEASWDYQVVHDSEDVQRRVMERLFRKQPPAPAMVNPAEDAALMAAANEVRFIARTFGKKEGDFADYWVKRVMATEDPKARLDILDECFVDLTLDCQGLEKALRRFRMLLAPHTAMVKNAKQHVRSLALKFDAAKQRFVEIWMTKTERGQKVEDPSEVLDECLISESMGGWQSRDCFDFEEALRNYKTAAELWAFQP